MTREAPPLILASASPRRAEVLKSLGLEFEVLPPRHLETPRDGESPESYVERLSREKALAVAGQRPDALVLAGDTVVVLEGEVLGKPRSSEDAVEMLVRLSGRSHTVATGIALVAPASGALSRVSTTRVLLRSFGPDEARDYVASGEPMDKAGAYGIQGKGAALVAGIDGDYFTVMGFPVPAFVELLEEAGWRYAFGRLRPLRASS